jgi:hypothetical protein
MRPQTARPVGLELEELKAKTAENAVSDDANADTLNDIDPRARSTNVATDGMMSFERVASRASRCAKVRLGSIP